MLAELAASPSTETTAVLAAIGEMSQKMDVRFNSLDAASKANQATLDEHETRLSDVEHANSAHDGRLSAVEQQVKRLEDANKALLEKVIDLEARSRRQNIKIIGLPENVEDGRPVDFVSNLIFGRENFSKPVEVDRAHRLGSLGSATATAANKPRVMIARIHSYRVKDSIIKIQATIAFDVTRGNQTSTFNTPEEAKFFADCDRQIGPRKRIDPLRQDSRYKMQSD
ncbi:hypothetical protein WMY93_033590 [Mugilogobius chulae]|uniref:L1 transposable element RRM domain-containing protein n=1 Tax=Mugilogobius chulae TaxID=88201 RepID=A0AAW0MKM4_9GOBI